MSWKTSFDQAAAVDISKRAASTILFCKGGVTVRQVETETVKEYRGLSKDAAQGQAGVTDSTVQTVYYRKIDNVVHSISVMSGSKTEKVATRTNEADGWTVTERTVTYTVTPVSAGVPTGWSTSLAAADIGGRTVSQSRSAQHIASATYEHNGQKCVASLMSLKTVTVTEYTGLSEAQKTSILNSNATANASQYVWYFVYTYDYTSNGNQYTGTAVGRYAVANEGSTVYSSASLGADGWTVTVTTETYTVQQSGHMSTPEYRWKKGNVVS